MAAMGFARSCGDRHCPRCLAAKSRQWLEQQTRSLLPTTYYHCVLTLPEELNALVLANPSPPLPAVVRFALPRACSSSDATGFKGDLGISAVLHTWGQQLDFHPHLHCIVTGGALSRTASAGAHPNNASSSFPSKRLAHCSEASSWTGSRQMLEEPGALHLPDSVLSDPRVRQRWFSKLYAQKWVVYAKRPFGGPEQVLNYLANYTHRVALSNRRIVAVDEQAQTVTFTWRDYRQGGTVKPLTLSAREFIRRFRCIFYLRVWSVSGITASWETTAGSGISLGLVHFWSGARAGLPSCPSQTAPADALSALRSGRSALGGVY